MYMNRMSSVARQDIKPGGSGGRYLPPYPFPSRSFPLFNSKMKISHYQIPAESQRQELESVRPGLTGNISLRGLYVSEMHNLCFPLNFFVNVLYTYRLNRLLHKPIWERREGEGDNQHSHWNVFPKCAPRHYCARP